MKRLGFIVRGCILRAFEGRVKFKLLITAIQFPFIDLNAACGDVSGAYRFKSPFKMTDSAISFIDLRRCWLSRLSFGELDSHEFLVDPN